MNDQPNRLAAGVAAGFAGSEIDRGKPLRFRLNGQVVHGFAGDTVLTAALASGLLVAGTRGRETLGLDERFAPPILPAGRSSDRHLALPMDRCPALDGVDLETLGARRPTLTPGGPLDAAREWIYGPRRTLGHRYDGISGLDGPWLDATPGETIEADLAIIGGGIAGLGAAVAAGEAGERVILVERREYLGGDATFFGVAEGEDQPQAAIKQLIDRLARLPNVEILTRAEAFSLSGRKVRVHQVQVADGTASGRTMLLSAKRIVIATGAFERLPVFPGNRSPGVTGAVAALHRAERFGVWIGTKSLFSTVSNHTYRLAIRAAEAGIRVQRVHDARGGPQSRFIDFSKASGVALAFGLVPGAVTPAGRGLSGLYTSFTIAMDGRAAPGGPVWTEQLVLCGGWQPALSLWLAAGGATRWLAQASRMEAVGELPAVALAGAAAGYRGMSACARSGEAAVARLRGDPVPPVEDPQIDRAFETQDAPASVASNQRAAASLSYLDGGASLTVVPGTRRFARVARLLGLAAPQRQLADQPRPLSFGDVAAAVQLGAIPPNEAGAVAAERCVLPATVADNQPPKPSPPHDAVHAIPAYLSGRFGPRPVRWTIDPIEPRDLEAGCLIYVNSETADPSSAIGVVLTPAKDGAIKAVALIGKSPAAAGDRFVLRDSGGAVRIQLVEKA